MFVAIRHHLQSAVLPTRAGLVVVCGVLMSWSVSGLAAEDERSVLALSEALARVLQSSLTKSAPPKQESSRQGCDPIRLFRRKSKMCSAVVKRRALARWKRRWH